MGDDPAPGEDQRRDRADAEPEPSHPWLASIVLVTAVVVLLFVLALVSTFR
jgi:hypothetical protein